MTDAKYAPNEKPFRGGNQASLRSAGDSGAPSKTLYAYVIKSFDQNRLESTPCLNERTLVLCSLLEIIFSLQGER